MSNPKTCRIAIGASNKAGNTQEHIKLIRELAEAHIEIAIEEKQDISLEELSKKIMQDLPGTGMVDVWNSFRQDYKFPKKGEEDQDHESEARSWQNELKVQAALESKVEALLDKAYDKIIDGEKVGKADIDTEETRRIRNNLREIQSQILKTIRRAEAKNKMLSEIEEIRELLRDDLVRPDVEQEQAVRGIVDPIREQLKDLREQLSSKRKLKELQDRLEAKEYDLQEAKEKQGDRKTDSPELAAIKRDVKLLTSEINMRRNLSKKIAELNGKLNDQPVKERSLKGERPVNSQEVQGMLEEVSEIREKIKQRKESDREVLKAAMWYMPMGDKQKQDSLEAIEENIRDIQAGNLPMPKPKRSTDPEIAEARKRYNLAKKKLMTKKSIKDLEKQIKTGEWKFNIDKPTAKREAQIDDELLKLRIEQEQLRKKINGLIEDSRDRSIVEKVILETNMVTRGLLLSGEMGFIGRQTVTWFLNPFYTNQTFKNVGKTLAKARTERGSAEVMLGIKNHALFLEAQKAGLFFRDPSTDFIASEEYTQSWLLRKIPGLNQYIDLNDRMMSSYINMMSHDTFFAYIEANPNATKSQKEEMAKLINASVGRGSIMGADKWANSAKHVLLAPRFMISRFEAPWRAAKIIFSRESSAQDRMFAAKQWGGFITTASILVGLASMLEGVEVGTDPDETDFLKILWGDKRIDIWGGYLQPAQMLLRLGLMAARSQDIIDGKAKYESRDALDEIMIFLKYRTSTLAQLLNNLVPGETFEGDKIPSIWAAMTNREDFVDWWKKFGIKQVTPLYLEEVATAWGMEGKESAIVSAILGFLGIGASTY
jgi:hypothetical protein